MNRTRLCTPAQQGFTLIEIMVVVVIIGVLGALVVPQFLSRPDQAKVTAARSDIQAISMALELYRLDNRHYPSTDQGLEVLVTRSGDRLQGLPAGAQGYLRAVPRDPWGALYRFNRPGTRSNEAYDLFSLGADGQPGGEGFAADIGNWEP